MSLFRAGLVAFFCIFSYCVAADYQDVDAQLVFEVATKLFMPSGSRQLVVPAVLAVDERGQCFASAYSRKLYSDEFSNQLDERAGECHGIDVASIADELDVSFVNSGPQVTFLILTDTGGLCKNCSSILEKFDRSVLAHFKPTFRTIVIDTGMSARFQRN